MIVDFHSHFVPQDFPAPPSRLTEAGWPRMIPAESGARTLFIGERKFRELHDLYWDVPRRIAAMEAEGVGLQIISPLPELLCYWINPVAGVMLTSAVNAECAKMVAASSGKLLGLGILPLQDLNAARYEIEAIARTPGLVGILVGSNVNGVSIADEAFDPIMAAAEQHGLLVFVHGIRPLGADRLAGPPLMNAVIGIPHENTAAIASFMARDVAHRFPNLQLVFSHGGGGIGAVLDRMQLIWENFSSMRASMTVPPVEAVRRFWYDSAVFGADYTGYLIKRFGAERILAGTDGPTEVGQKDLLAFLAATGATPAEQQMMGGENALRLLALAGGRRIAA